MADDRLIRYTAGDQQYDIPESQVEEFEKDMPDATVKMTAGGSEYSITAKERPEFMNDFSDASYAEVTEPKPRKRPSFFKIGERNAERTPHFDVESPIYQQNKEFIDEYEQMMTKVPGGPTRAYSEEEQAALDYRKKNAPRYRGLMAQAKEAKKNPYMGKGLEELETAKKEALGEDEEFYNEYLQKKALADQIQTVSTPAGGGYIPTTTTLATPEQREAEEFVRKNQDRFNKISGKLSQIEKAQQAAPEIYQAEQNLLAETKEAKKENKEQGGKMPSIGYETADRIYKRTEKLLEADNKYWNATGYGAIHGAVDKAASLDFITRGLSELIDDDRVLDVQKKMRKAAEEASKEVDGMYNVVEGRPYTDKEKEAALESVIDRKMAETMSQEEMNILKAYAGYTDALTLRAHDKTAGYNAGEMAAESAGYMADFILTGGVMNAAKSAVTKAMSSWAAKNLLGKALPEVVGTLAGTVARTQLMPSTYKNIYENRMLVDEDGNQMSWWEAFAKGQFKAINDNFFENSGIVMDKALMQAFKGIARMAPSTAIGTTLSRYLTEGAKVLDRGGIQSFFSEPFEEVVGAANSSIVGSLTGGFVGDKDELPSLLEAENFGTMAISFLPMLLPQAVGSIRGYRDLQDRYTTAIEHLQPLVDEGKLSGEALQNLANNMAEMSPKDLSKTIIEMGKSVKDNGGTLPQSFFTDVYTLMEKRAADNFMGDEWADSAEKRALADAMIIGEMANEQNLYDINKQWEAARTAGEEAGYSDDMLDDDPMQLYAEAMRIKDSDPKGSEILLNMARANAMKEGINKTLADRITSDEEAADRFLEDHSNNGYMMTAQTREGQTVYIKSSDAKVDEDGNVILPESEGLAMPVLVMDMEGNVSAVPASELTIDQAVTLEDASDFASQTIREAHRQNYERWAKTLSPEAKSEEVKSLEGSTVLFRKEDGSIGKMTISVVDEDGMVVIDGAKKDVGNNIYLPAEQVWDSLVLDSNGRPVGAYANQEQTIEEEPTPQQVDNGAELEPVAETQPVSTAEVPLVDGRPSEDGNAYLNGTYRVTIGGNPVDATVTGVEDNGIGVVISYTDQNGRQKTASMDAASFGQNALDSRTEPTAEVQASEEEAPQAEVQEPEAEEVDYNVLMNDGNVEAGARAVVADFGEDAAMFVDNNLAAAKKAADQAEKATPKSTDRAQFKAEAAAIREQKEATQKALAFWQGVKTALETPAVEEAPAVAEEAPVAPVAEEAPEVAPTPAETPVAETPEQTPTPAEEPTPTPEPTPAPQARNANEPILSEEKDYYGNQFITAPDGTIDFGSIPAESGLMAGPIRISIGDKGAEGREAYGLAATGLSYPRAMRHIQSVLGNPARIVRGMDTDGKGYNSIIVAGRRGPNGTPFVELTEEDGYWMLHDIGIDDTGRAINSREEIYTRGGKPRAEGSYDLSVRPDEKARGGFSLAQRRRILRSTKRVKAAIEKYAKPLNTDIVIVESLDDIPEDQKDARRVMERYMADHSQPLPEAWFNNGKIYFVAPALQGRSEQYIASKIAHEVVAHNGLRGLMGNEFDGFCDRVFDSMGEKDRREMTDYALKSKTGETRRQYKIAEAKSLSGRKLTKKEQTLLDRIHREAADEYVAHLAENTDANPTLWDKIVAWVKEVLAKMNINLDLNDRDLAVALARSRERLEDMGHVAKGKDGLTPIEGEEKGDAQHSIKASTDEMVSDETPDNTSRFSMNTWENGGRDDFISFVDKQIKLGNLSEDSRETFISRMDKVYDEAKIIYESGNFETFNEWNDLEVARDRNGNSIYTVIKPNSEYGMNLDFSLVCKKRRALNAILNDMIDRNLVQYMGSANDDLTIARIADIIRNHGFETACRLCFVDAKRFRQVKVADDFVQLYNGLVNKLIPRGSKIKAGYFDFAKTGRHNIAAEMLDQASDDQINIAALQKIVDLEDKAKKDKPGRTVTYKIAKHLLENPQDRKFVQREDFISTRGFEAVKAENEAVLGLYNSKKGSGGPKAAESDVQYQGEVSKSNWSPEEAFKVGGVRIQSFSDFMPHMVFDYMQMFADLAAGRYPAHAYTKEELFVKLFGLTGTKINMSLVPSVVEGGIAPGLDANGNYTWQEGETFPYEEAVRIQNTEGYRENCGTIAVGISDAHILKMLADPNIRMVIPYHKSGLNKKIAVYNGIDKFSDYTSSQNTRYADGKKLSQPDHEKEPNFNELLRSEGDPNAAAKKYLDWCREHNYIPKFEKFAYDENGNMREGYYKMLEDFTTYVPNDEGGFDYYPQRALEFELPQEGSPLGSTDELMRRGLAEEEAVETRLKAEAKPIVDEVEEMLNTRYSLAPSGAEMYRESADLFDAAKERFGTTNDIREAGYVLPDGAMLDFSGRHQVDPNSDSSYLAGDRHVDHRDIADLNYERDLNTPSGRETSMTDFINRGAIRIHDGRGAMINLSKKPSVEQRARLNRLIDHNRGDVWIDFDNNGSTDHYVEYEGARADRVLNDIDRYYDEGYRPEGNTRFSLSNANQRIFISNAEKAVESIKQDKATPEQWKKMIEKNGGLKAGEDKWLGLSMWLDASDRKTLTKQEVLDFIGENEIKIEETLYGTPDQEVAQKMKKFEDEYKALFEEAPNRIEAIEDELEAFWDEMRAKYGEDWESAGLTGGESYREGQLLEAREKWQGTPQEAAFDEMVDKYGDDFRDAFTPQWNLAGNVWLDIERDIYDNPVEAAQYFLETNRPINSTRLDYTTEGLTNKQEIALTVPTIEPWNESDEIHFGDAGEGRAISWARFGDAGEYNGESQAKRDKIEAEHNEASAALESYRKELMAKYEGKEKPYYQMATEEEQARLDALKNEERAKWQEYVRAKYDAEKPDKKVLFIDEIQSKRHQEAREKGYRVSEAGLENLKRTAREANEAQLNYGRSLMEKYNDDLGWMDKMTDEEEQRLRELEAASNEAGATLGRATNGIPAAPFEKNWPELTMKRMLRYAAENGYDVVAWTTGEQQSERYGLGHIVNAIERQDVGEGKRFVLYTGSMIGVTVDEEGVVTSSNLEELEGKPLSAIVGKEVAIKMMRMEDGETFDAEDMRIGGEGMKGFYDDILPRFMNKYGKQWGVSTRDASITLEEGKQIPAHAVDVNDAMKSSVMEGQTMFSLLERVNDRISAMDDTVDELSEDERKEIEQTNDTFNKKLDGLTPKSIESTDFDLGRPSSLLRKAGVQDKPMRLYGSKLRSKKETHGFDYGEIRDLPLAVADPIAVFNNHRKPGDRAILTELKTKDGNVLVSVNVGKNNDVDFNIVTSLFGKNGEGVLRWLDRRYDTYINKEKALRYLHLSAPIAEASDKSEPLSGDKDSNNFGNNNTRFSLSDQNAREVAADIADRYDNQDGSNEYPWMSENVLFDAIEREMPYGQDTKKLFSMIDEYRRLEEEDFNGGKRDFSGGEKEELFNDILDELRAVGGEKGEPERRPSIAETAREAMDDQIRWSLAGQPGNVTPTADMARAAYDRRVANVWNKIVTEFQDKNRPVRILIDEIQKVTGNRPIEDYEDYLTMENQQSSVSHAQTENFERFYWMPILKQIDAIMKKLGGKEAYDDIIRYMMSKHGLERNEYYDNERGEVRDWSGLTALYGYESDMVADAEDEARQYVADFENEVGAEDIDELWRLTKEATDKILRHSYAGGNISRDTYDYVRNMFQYYIPLRGFEQDMAEDVYGYLGLGNNRFGGKYKKVGGRTTIADNPIATIMQMAETEISNAASNRAKTALYNYLITRQDTNRLDANGNYIPQSLATIKNAWYEVSTDSAGNRVCRLALPNIPSNASAERVNEEWNKFEEEMKAKAKNGEAFQSKKGLKLPYPLINDFHGREHAITVNIGGEQKVIWINGDNEAARAVNNTQRKDMGAIEQALRMLNRNVSSMFTNYSLGFTARNLFRDTIYSRMAISAKEGPKYNIDYRKNWWKNFAGTGAPIMKMLNKYENGGMRNASGLTATEKTFKEFMENGGETGYTFIHSVEQNKARIEREMKMMKKGRTVSVGKALRWCGESVEFLNQAFELLTRFTAFQTSRDQGRSIQRSIKDSKEVSVNFGTRGAQSGRGLAGIVARFFGATHFFFNAGMQGMNNFLNLFKTKKGAALTGANLAGLVTAGAIIVPLINTWLAYMLGDGDDDDNYYDMPDYIRRNNLCVGWGDNYVMIPLPIELRAFFGMGDIINGVVYDKRADRSFGSIAGDLVAQTADILPLNPIEGSADMGTLGAAVYNTLVPDVVSPIVEAAFTNRSFSGAPIYKKYTGQENYPEYMKAFSGAPSALVALAEKLYGLNRGLPPKGGIGLNPMNLNPEVVDHLLKGYGGGMYTLLKQISRLIDDIPAVQKVFPFTEGEKFKVAEVPIIGDVWRHKEEENEQDFYTRAYYDFKEIKDRVSGRLRPLGSDKDVYSDEDNDITRKARIYGGAYYDIAKEFYKAEKEQRKLKNQLAKETDEEKKAEIEAQLRTWNEDLIDRLLEMN